MKQLALILAGLVLAGSAMAATTPTPVPTATPTPTPVPIIPWWQDQAEVNAYLVFSGSTAATDLFVNHRTGQDLTVPTGYTLYITDINWTCASEANIDIKWNTASTTYIDSVRFGSTSQGKVISYTTPLYSPNPGDYPKLHFNASSAGVVFLQGYIR